MKKRLLSLIIGIALLATFTTAQATPTSVVRVGYYGFSGFMEQQENGSFSGYYYDYLQEIAAYTGWTYQFIYGTWEDCLERLEQGEVDLLCGAIYTDERAQQFHYSTLEAGMEFAVLLVPRTQENIYYNDFSSFNGLRIGQLTGNEQNSFLKEYAQTNGFIYESANFDSIVELKNAMSQGHIDAILISSLHKVLGEKTVARFHPTPYYFITSKEQADLCHTLDKAMEQIQISDLNFAVRLNDRHYGDSSEFRAALTREEADYVRAAPMLRVAVLQDWQPMSYLDAEGNYTGICAELLDLISRRSGFRLEYLPVASEDEATRMVQKGNADLAFPLPAQSAQRAQTYGLTVTKPFYEADVTLAVREGTELSAVRQVAIPAKVLALNTFLQEQYPNAIPVTYPDTPACLDALQRGEVDALLENIFVLEQYRRLSNYNWLEPILSEQRTISLAIGIGEGQDENLRPLLNKVISQLEQDTVSNLVIRSTMAGVNVPLLQAVRPYIVPLVPLLAALVFLLSLRARRKAEKVAYVDPVTGWDNKNRFLLQAHKLLHGTCKDFWLISLDIDRFKLINDMHGLENGDLILKSMANLFADALRTGELFCRESNDLYLVLLKGRKEEIQVRLPAILEQTTTLPHLLNINFRITLSCGVYELRDCDQNLQKAIILANIAREQAKTHRQDWIAYYSDDMRWKATREQEIVNRMEAALANREFQVHYQPKIGLDGVRLVGAEALVRWIPKAGNTIYPDEFIPVFESNGFITKLDVYVFEQVCSQIRTWLDKGITPCPISVNLSRVHLDKEDFHLQYLAILQKHRVHPRFVELELTESAIFENKAAIAALIGKLKTMGIQVSIDDFGSGYSSLNLIKDMQFDYLKLDKEFLNESSDNERGRRVIQSVIYLADKLNMMVVAEGVETQEQVDFLRQAHCDIVQGYYYSRPLPLEEFEHFCGFAEQTLDHRASPAFL